MLDIDANGVITDLSPGVVWQRQQDAARQAEIEAAGRASRARREETQRLRGEIERAVHLMQSPITAAAARRTVGQAVARLHDCTIRESSSIPAGVYAFAEVRARTAVMPPDWFESDEGLVAIFHEVAHVLNGECPRTEPHRPDRTVRAFLHCLECERLAWLRAMEIAPVFSSTMFERLRQSLAISQRTTPASATVVAAADTLASNLTYCQDVQARMLRAARIQWVRNVISDTERERSRR